MMQCQDINELMMDFLYQELEHPRAEEFRSHVASCARCGAELASLERTRTAFRELPEAEPPAAVTARLLHEAARRAPRAVAVDATEEKPGLFAWLSGMFRPIYAHPGLAAAFSLIVVLGTVGYLKLTGRVSEKSQSNPAMSEAAERERNQGAAAVAPRAPAVAVTTAPTGATVVSEVGAAAPAAPEPSAVDSLGKAGGHATGDGAGYSQGVEVDGRLRDNTDTGADLPAKGGGLYADPYADSVRGARVTTPDEELQFRGVLDGDSKDVGRGEGGAGGKLEEKAQPARRAAEPKPAVDREVAADDDAAEAETVIAADKPADVNAKKKGKPVLGGAEDEGQFEYRKADAKPAAQPGPPPVEAPAPSTPPSPDPRPTAGAPGGTTGTAGSGGGGVNERGRKDTTTRDQTKVKTKVAKSEPAQTQEPQKENKEVAKLHTDAQKQARSGNCVESFKLRQKIQKVDMDYYNRNVVRDQVFAPCDRKEAEKNRAKKPAPKQVDHDEQMNAPVEIESTH